MALKQAMPEFHVYALLALAAFSFVALFFLFRRGKGRRVAW
jgi:hypothetical protein